MAGTQLLAVASEDDRGLLAPVSAHFGHCPYFTLVAMDGAAIGETRVVANPYHHAHTPGAIPRFVHSLGASAIITGGMGGRAVDLFHSFGVAVGTGATGSVGDAVAAFLDGRFREIVPCAHPHGGCGGDEHPHEDTP